MYIATGLFKSCYQGAEFTYERPLEPTRDSMARAIITDEVSDVHRVLQIGALDADVSREIALHIAQISLSERTVLHKSVVAFCERYGVDRTYTAEDEIADGFAAMRETAADIAYHNAQRL